MVRGRTRKICRFCEEKVVYIDYKDEKKITKFTTEQGKIIPRRISGNCAKHQKELAAAIKRARHLALIPFVADATR
ncbi:30S ribosomal protein S18 [bacterium]|nr:30S ribosomal protein S18 [bacterium]